MSLCVSGHGYLVHTEGAFTVRRLVHHDYFMCTDKRICKNVSDGFATSIIGQTGTKILRGARICATLLLLPSTAGLPK